MINDYLKYKTSKLAIVFGKIYKDKVIIMVYVFSGMKFSRAKTQAALEMLESTKKKKGKILFIDSEVSSYTISRLNNINLDSLLIKHLRGVDIKNEVLNSTNKFTDIIIDCGHGTNLKNALEVADFLFVPFLKKDRGLWAIWTITNMAVAVDIAWDSNSELQAYSYFISDKDIQVDEVALKALRKNQYIKYTEKELIS